MGHEETAQVSEDFVQVNSRGFMFAAFAIGYEIMVGIVYGILFDFNSDAQTTFIFGDLLLVSVLTILAIVGFGLVNSYITNASFSGMAMTLLIFALTVQHYFLMRAFWNKAGTNDPVNSTKTWDDRYYKKISFANMDQDRGNTYDLSHASWADAIACVIAMLVCFSSVVGRVQLIDVFFMTLFGSFFYEVTNQLLWRIFITDIGFGMRIFIFGSFMGLVAGFLLDRNKTTLNNRRYMSLYASRGIGLLGLVIVFCAFPFLCVAGLYHTSTNYAYIQYIAPFNMWLALGAGVLGSFSASAITYRKISVHDLIFSGISGGIAFSSSSDLHRNPAVPMTVGFVVGFGMSLYHSKQIRKMNKKGVVSSLAYVNRFLIPGVISSILSAILQAIQQGSKDMPNYQMRYEPSRTNISQGGYQIIGLLLCAGIGSLSGVIVGLLWKIFNRNTEGQQFNDNTIYQADFKKLETNKHLQDSAGEPIMDYGPGNFDNPIAH